MNTAPVLTFAVVLQPSPPQPTLARTMGALFSSGKKIPTSITFTFLTKPPTTAPPHTTTSAQGETKEPTLDQDEDGLTLSAEMADYIARGKQILKALENFASTSEVQRFAMQNSKDEKAQEVAFEAVLPNALLVKSFFEYANEMEQTAPTILNFIIEKGTVQQWNAKSEQQWLETNQNVVHCLCDVLTFALLFDNIKQMSPDCQNDFAYYRRNMGKFHERSLVGEAETNTISMWLANGTPMMTRLTDAFGNVYKSSNGSDGVKHMLANIANVTCSMLMRGDLGQTSLTDPATENLQYCLCLMTSAIILFDRVIPTGVFRKKSGCEIKKCVTQLKNNMPTSKTYLNCIRFSTKHFQDKDTPSALANLIEDARLGIK